MNAARRVYGLRPEGEQGDDEEDGIYIEFINDLNIVERCALAYMSHGLLPSTGGVLDQDESFWNDMMRWIAIYRDCEEEVENKRRKKAGRNRQERRLELDGR